jgi:hypothetical protein
MLSEWGFYTNVMGASLMLIINQQAFFNDKKSRGYLKYPRLLSYAD